MVAYRLYFISEEAKLGIKIRRWKTIKEERQQTSKLVRGTAFHKAVLSLAVWNGEEVSNKEKISLF